MRKQHYTVVRKYHYYVKYIFIIQASEDGHTSYVFSEQTQFENNMSYATTP